MSLGRAPRGLSACLGLAALGLALAGCAKAPPTVRCGEESVAVDSDAPIQRVAVRADLPLLDRRLPDLREATLRLPGVRGPVSVAVQRRDGTWQLACELPEPHPWTARIAAPAGQEGRPLQEGPTPLTLVAAGDVAGALTITARRPLDLQVRLGERTEQLRFGTGGERKTLRFELAERPVPISVLGGGRAVAATLLPSRLSPDEARQTLALERVVLPADSLGRPEAARRPDRIALPAPWWRAMQRVTGVGFRPRDAYAPWGQVGVWLRNSGDDDLTVLVQSRVLRDGQPAPAFAPRMRDADGGTGVVSGLARVPAGGSARATLPLFVDPALLRGGSVARELEVVVAPLGSGAPLWTERRSIAVRTGSTTLSLAFGVTLLAALLGLLRTASSLPRWLGEARTADLTTIAVFATLSFVVTAAATLLVGGASALLGPFSNLVLGLVHDTLRNALLATLLVLLPRPGTATLFVLLGWLLAGVGLGGFGPTDALFVGSRLFWLEGALWLVGATRHGRWRDGSWSRTGTLMAGFGLAGLLSTACSLAGHMVLYRLFYAPWFVVATLALPGFLYEVLACLIASPFAHSLRRVSP